MVMMHQAMRSILQQRTAMTIKIACTGGAFVRHCRLF
jgi:hypothetical protein